MSKPFELKKEHIKLLQSAFISWEDCEFGAPAIDCKRPYGNSSVIADIMRILEWKISPNEYGEYDEKWEILACQLHDETQTALQIILATKSFETGIYYKEDKYDSRSWKKFEGNE